MRMEKRELSALKELEGYLGGVEVKPKEIKK